MVFIAYVFNNLRNSRIVHMTHFRKQDDVRSGNSDPPTNQLINLLWGAKLAVVRT